MKKLPSGPRLEVNAIRILGNRVLPEQELQDIVKDAIGKSLTLSELEDVATRITKHYRIKGYFVARAYIPAQEVKDGVLGIRVVEGNYGRFIINNQSLADDDVVQGILDAIKDYDIVSLDTLERAMLIANETPGVRVTRADVMPGEKVGTSDFAVDTSATARKNGFVLIDNYGSRYTGINRLSFAADLNEPSGRGDRLSLSGMVSNGRDLENLRLAYGWLVKPNGLRGELALAKTRYSLGDSFEDLGVSGEATSVDASLGYPIKKTRNSMIDVNVSSSFKKLTATIEPTKYLWSATSGIAFREEGIALGTSGLTQAAFALTVGSLRDEGNTDEFAKFTADASRVALLPKDFKLTGQVRFQQSLNGKNLDGSEQMGVSGSNGVMAYPSGELSGSNAIFARVELTHPLPSIASAPDFTHQGSLYSSWGQASQPKAVSATDRRREVSDVGLSWTGNFKSVAAKVTLAHRLQAEAPTSEPADRNRLLAQLSWAF
ncbi:MAG: ShlB/FhaC/HecB family hemolysin secretion/activation protein [Litorivicinaceae bacterium]